MLESAVANREKIDGSNVEALLREIIEALTLAVSEVQKIAENPGPEGSDDDDDDLIDDADDLIDDAGDVIDDATDLISGAATQVVTTVVGAVFTILGVSYVTWNLKNEPNS